MKKQSDAQGPHLKTDKAIEQIYLKWQLRNLKITDNGQTRSEVYYFQIRV